MPADLRLVAEPSVAIAAGVGIEWIELRGGDMCPGWRGQKREGAEILADDVAVRRGFRHLDLGALLAGLPDVVGGAVACCTLAEIREGGLPIDRLVIRKLGDDRGFGRPAALF